jgi:hypothetical protein
LFYANDVNLLGDTKKEKRNFNWASTEIGLEVNTEKTKYMLLPRHQNAGQNHDIKIANRCFENVAQLKYLGPIITIQNVDSQGNMNSGNACYHTVQKLLSSYLMFKT